MLRSHSIDQSFQSAELRQPEETLTEVLDQLNNALRPGAQTKLSNAVRETGISDTTNTHFLNFIVSLGKELQQLPGSNEEEISRQLQEKFENWLGDGSREGRVNPLLTTPGKYRCILLAVDIQ